MAQQSPEAANLLGCAERLDGARSDYDRLLARIGDARFVLLGEASHGTHQFYRERALITQRLIQERGFHAVAIEGDWPDAYRANLHVQGLGQDPDADAALRGFERFPTWIWQNREVSDFLGWLTEHNSRAGAGVGVYGLDLYSLFASIEAILASLERLDPPAARRARERYACFDHFNDDAELYAFATGLGVEPSCEQQVIEQLRELSERATTRLAKDGPAYEDELFYVEQNARLVRNAEQYYRTMFRARASSWNLRDQHMFETLEALAAHLDRRFGGSKVVVWAHNSHLGDARFTSMFERGEHNLGQLAREHYGNGAFLVGFTTYTGTVTAASDWGEPAQRKAVRPALPDSYEALFHGLGLPRFALHFEESSETNACLLGSRLERAMGVIYRPQTERASHYFRADLARQFDAVIHIDETRALEPLEPSARWVEGDVPETYPFAV